MRIATREDIGRIEAICNLPEIRMWTACDGATPTTGAKWVTAPSFSVIGEEGCFLAKQLDPGRYAIHTNLLPEHRGLAGLKACREALAVAFLQTDALQLVTYVPATIPQAGVMARMAGFRHVFDRPKLWPVDGVKADMGFYVLTIDDWIARGNCNAAGQAFHARLHGELGAPAHPEDPIHNNYVGAAVDMIRAGQVHKALEVFNQFARFAGYQPVKLVSTAPLRIDIRDCVLRIEGETFHKEAAYA